MINMNLYTVYLICDTREKFKVVKVVDNLKKAKYYINATNKEYKIKKFDLPSMHNEMGKYVLISSDTKGIKIIVHDEELMSNDRFFRKYKIF